MRRFVERKTARQQVVREVGEIQNEGQEANGGSVDKTQPVDIDVNV